MRFKCRRELPVLIYFVVGFSKEARLSGPEAVFFPGFKDFARINHRKKLGNLSRIKKGEL